MRRLITFSCLATFVAFFLAASVAYFKNVAYPPQSEIDAILKVTLFAALGGVALAQALFEFNIIQSPRFGVRSGIGMLMGLVLFWGIFFSEHVMSTMKLKKAVRDPEVFSVVQGHCGVYSGRGLVRWYQQSFDPDLQNKMASFTFSNQCRIDHFLDLRRRQQIPCQSDEDSVACLGRWMLTFSKKGFWNLPTRKMFFDEAKTGTIAPGDAEADKKWISYALRDYELELSHPTMIQQAGVQEDFNDLHHYYKLKDEYDNLVLTKEIFTYAEKNVKDDKTAEAQKFKEVRKEVNLKLERIPELEEDIKNTQAKIQL